MLRSTDTIFCKKESSSRYYLILQDCRGLVTYDTHSQSVTYNEDTYSTGLMSSFVRRGTKRLQTSVEPVGGSLVALAVAQPPPADSNGQRYFNY